MFLPFLGSSLTLGLIDDCLTFGFGEISLLEVNFYMKILYLKNVKISIIFLGEKNVLIITKGHVKFLHGQRLHSKCRVRCAGGRRSPFPCGITEVPSSPLYFYPPKGYVNILNSSPNYTLF